jgi:uracil-DNA glycosylase
MPDRPDPASFPPPPLPSTLSAAALGQAAQRCRACDLHAGATQAVFGAGPASARVMLVGEQPGDREDIEGRPFVGPAGRILDEALERSGIPRGDAYVTNAVKHFRYRMRGKRRIHQRPDRWQVRACLPWLEAELQLIGPEALVLLGATAAQALIGSQVRVGESRGTLLHSDLARFVTVTAHPSSILRVSDRGERHRAMDAFVADLSAVAGWIAGG